MLKVLVWVVSNDGRFFNAAMNILERQHNGIEFVAVTAGAPIQLVKDGRKITFIPLDKVSGGGYDVLFVVGAKEIGMSKIVPVARQFNLPEEKLLGDWIVCIPGFTLEKYRRLQRSRLSIISMNCFGGLIYHMLGLPFYSPFINMFLVEEEYIRFLGAPRVYMKEKLTFNETYLKTNSDVNYPVFTLGNVNLHFNHYDQTNENVFDKRRQRINWYNLFVTMYTKDEKILREFDALPYGKKVCFVSFKSNLDSAWYINTDINPTFPNFSDKINRFGVGDPFFYDPFDMLLYGKKTQLIEM